ncbi:hypothetical protein [Actinomadura bangladeshensis]|uniref:Uncharacterized protein n=1 Tax=Actinomadura bangladeshensis TaxID=453573 RepID=A0A4R4P556_9ACTN|nr:hypothetical protein [Actinomadura bangladeshensis]TDC17059.1 hypothetical protein E1284_10435 [Actinomadura bangladeshensis]
MSETEDTGRAAPVPDEANEADAAEQRAALDEYGAAEGAPLPEDANDADAAEQRAALDEEDQRVGAAPMPDEANDADVAEQRREVRLDEDEYR